MTAKERTKQPLFKAVIKTKKTMRNKANVINTIPPTTYLKL